MKLVTRCELKQHGCYFPVRSLVTIAWFLVWFNVAGVAAYFIADAFGDRIGEFHNVPDMREK